MQLKAKKQDILSVLSVVEKAMATKNPILSTHGLLIEASSNGLCLTANNLEVSIKGTIPATGIDPGSTVVPPRFCQIIRNVDEDIEISVKNNIADIISGKSRLQLSCIDPENFPSFRDELPKEPLTFKDKELRDALSKVLFAVSRDQTRAVFTATNIGLKGNKFYAIATDTHRLAEYTADISGEDFQMLVPGKTLKDVYKAFSNDNEDVKFYQATDKSSVVIEYRNFVFRLPLLSEQFPSMDRVFPAEPKTTIKVNAAALGNAVYRASLLAEEGNRVALDIESGGITVAASNDTGKSVEHVEADVTGEDVKVLLNSNYIQDGIKAVGAELLDITFHGPNGPCVFIQNGYRYLVLPFRMERK